MTIIYLMTFFIIQTLEFLSHLLFIFSQFIYFTCEEYLLLLRYSISLNSYLCLALEKPPKLNLTKKSNPKKKFKLKKSKKLKRKNLNLPQNPKNMSRKVSTPCKESKEANIKESFSYQPKETKAVGHLPSSEYIFHDLDNRINLLCIYIDKCSLLLLRLQNEEKTL